MEQQTRTSGSGRPRSRARIVIGGVLVFAVLVSCMEFALGLIDLPRYDRLFAGTRSYPLFVRGEGERSDSYVTNPHFEGSLNLQTFSLDKPAATKRVFVVGGSAAFGWPYGEGYGFSGFLRRGLESVAPGRFEIVNASGMSYGSHRVLDFVGEIVAYQPDLVVIYSGNNEYVERSALPKGERQQYRLFRLRDWLRKTNTYRAVRLAMFRISPAIFRAPPTPDPTDLRARAVRRETPFRSAETDSTVLAEYRSNLSRMAEILRDASVRAVFCTVPVNLGDWPPMQEVPRLPDAQQLRRWRLAWEEGLAHLRRGESRAARDAFRDVLSLTPGHAGAVYYLGKALQQGGEVTSAKEALVRAKDEDPRPIRALSSLNQAVRSTAGEARGSYLLDLEKLFADHSPNGIPGAALFLDYVHPSEEGHRLIAQALVPIVAGESPSPIDSEGVSSAIGADRGYRDENPTLEAYVRYAQGMSLQRNGLVAEAERAYLDAVRLRPDLSEAYYNLATVYAGQGRLDEAERMYEDALAVDADSGVALAGLGGIRLYHGDLDGARTLLERSLRVDPNNPDALEGWGYLLYREGRPAEAAKSYQRVIDLGADTGQTHRLMGMALSDLGDRAGALSAWEKAVQLDPGDEESARRIREETPRLSPPRNKDGEIR